MSASNYRRSGKSFNTPTSKHFVKHEEKSIETTVTNKSIVAEEWVREIRNKHGRKANVVVGLDAEWRPVYVRGRTSKAAILQLCISDKCLKLQLLYMDKFPISLKRFFMDSKFTFVGVEVENDIRKLKEEYGLKFNQFQDIRELAKESMPGNFGASRLAGLKELAMKVCGVYLEKPKRVCMSNWEARTLSEEQVEYACLDAYASFCVGHKLLIG